MKKITLYLFNLFIVLITVSPISTALAQSKQTKRRVAVFGGSFDPPHLGHAAIVTLALINKESVIDEVWMIPTMPSPWKKQKASAAARRLYTQITADFVNLALKQGGYKNKKVFVNTIETDIEGGISRGSYNLMTTLAEQFKNAEFSFVVGEDHVTADPKDPQGHSSMFSWDNSKETERTGIKNPNGQQFINTFKLFVVPRFNDDGTISNSTAEFNKSSLPTEFKSSPGITLLPSVYNNTDIKKLFKIDLKPHLSSTKVREQLKQKNIEWGKVDIVPELKTYFQHQPDPYSIDIKE